MKTKENREEIMSNGIKLVSAILASLLIQFPIVNGDERSSLSDQFEKKCADQMFDVFDDENLSHEKLINSLYVLKESRAEIGGVRLDEILSYQKTSCQLEDLNDKYLLKIIATCEIDGQIYVNQGIDAFVNAQVIERITACRETVHKHLDEVYDKLSIEDRATFDLFQLYYKQLSIRDAESLLKLYLSGGEKEDGPVDMKKVLATSCSNVTRKELKELKLHLLAKYDDSIGFWSVMETVCKLYSERN